MKMRIFPLVVLVVLLIQTGCVSTIIRAQAPRPNMPRYLYPGVQGGIGLIISPFVGPKLDGKEITYYPILGTLCLIDLPCSFAVDTICLPYDVLAMTAFGRDRTGFKKRLTNKSMNQTGRVDSGNNLNSELKSEYRESSSPTLIPPNT